MNRGQLRLRELRKARNLSQDALASYLNTFQNTISRYERGERDPGIDELIAIADFFSVSLDYLVGRSDNPNICHSFQQTPKEQPSSNTPSITEYIDEFSGMEKKKQESLH